ncbi:MAG: S-layer family protein, partial [Lactobacillus sp.]|nr:S-layer family protein [Lactobacillus sp.]
MRSSFAKSIYVGAAVLGLAGLSAVTTTTASAKSSAAKVTSSKALTTDATTRNVTFTGTNALYSKPGTVKGAKVVATTTTAKNLNKSTTSRENFRAYRVAKTNRGSIYYKVVSYNKAYRGWVYGGKSDTAFAGGLTSYDTFKEGTLTADQKSGNYKLANPGKTKAGLTYKQPAWTQYKIGKTIADTTAYKDATFSVDKVGTRTREGDTWVHVVNQNTADTKADGWILLSNLTQTNAFNEASQVKVNINNLKGETLKSFNYSVGTAAANTNAMDNTVYDTTAAPTKFANGFAATVKNALAGTGYTVDGTNALNRVANLKSGSTLTIYATEGTQKPSTVSVFAQYPDTPSINQVKVANADQTKNGVADAATAQNLINQPAATTLFTGVEGKSFTATEALAYLNGNASMKKLT